MRGESKETRRLNSIQKELDRVRKMEEKLSRTAGKTDSGMADRLREKIPPKVSGTLEKAFRKAFAVVFEKGTGIVERSFHGEKIDETYEIQNFAVNMRGTRGDLRRLERASSRAACGNLLFTAIEGAGLGLLGIGLPDILLFTGLLLKGIYETSLHYGYDYHAPAERLLILKMIEAAVSKGEQREAADLAVDEYMKNEEVCRTDADMDMQMEATAKAMSSDMLFMKFIQGLPVVGVIGGMGNSGYYHKIMRYVGLKYRKRYLWSLNGLPSGTDRAIYEAAGVKQL